MFERFTEPARQTLFEARKEAVRQNSSHIEAEHLLVGLMTVRDLTTSDLSNARLTTDAMCTHRDELEAPRSFHAVAGIRTGHVVRAGETQPTPKPGEAFSQGSQRVLNCAAWEADRMHHRHIGTEHLLLGLLREDCERPASLIATQGFELPAVRQQIAKHTASLRHRVLTLDDVLEGLERLRRLVLQLRDAPADRDLLACIRDEMADLNSHFDKQ